MHLPTATSAYTNIKKKLHLFLHGGIALLLQLLSLLDLYGPLEVVHGVRRFGAEVVEMQHKVVSFVAAQRIHIKPDRWNNY
jgi:hypothetical protein